MCWYRSSIHLSSAWSDLTAAAGSIFAPRCRSRPYPVVMYSVMYVLLGPPGNHGQRPSAFCCSASFRVSRAVSSSSRLASNRTPTFRRAWLSAAACRTHGVSSRMTDFRSPFFSSGLSRAGVFFHWSNTRRTFGSLVATWRASELA